VTRLAFEGVAAARRGRTLFAHLSADLGAGDALLVTGRNGVGKSTLIRIAAGLLAPARGRVVAEGRVALLAEAPGFDGERSVVQALRFWAGLDGVARPEARVEAALDALDLDALAPVATRLLSTGQRRRVAMARVIAAAAPIWLLDEPANGLDAAAVALLELLIDRHRSGGGIALVASHVPVQLPDARTIVLDAAA